MRILLVIYGDLEQQTGGYRYDARLVAFLRERGHRVDLFSQIPGSYGMRLLQDAPGRLLRAVQEHEPDLILEDELNHPSLIRGNRRLRLHGELPIVSVVHHLASSEEHGWIRGFMVKRIEKAYLRTIDGAVFNTPATRRAAEELRGSELPGVVALPSMDGLREIAGTRRDGEAPGNPSGGELRLLTVGSLIRRKRIDAVIGALALLGDPGVSLTIVGDDSAEPGTARSLRRLPGQLGVGGQVRFVGSLDDEALHEAYSRADLFVLPSQHEGFGMVYLEAMARGVPVVATSAGGAGAIVRDRENGFICKPGSSADVARIIKELRERPDELTRLSREARRSAGNHPTWEESFAKAEAFFTELVNRRSVNGLQLS